MVSNYLLIVKKLSKQKRKNQIILSAMKLFAQNGFNGTTTHDIAKTAKISEALLFKFFPHKSSLYSAIIDYRIKQTGDYCNIMQLFNKTTRGFFIEIVKSHIENIEKDDTFMRILLFSALEGHKLFKEFYETKISKVTSALANYIEDKVKTNEFKKVNPVIAAIILMGMVYNYLLLKKIFNIKEPPLLNKESVVKTIVDIFLNGIANKTHTDRQI